MMNLKSIACAVVMSCVVAKAGPLETAKELAASRFDGWTYGSDATKKQVDCVQFLVAVVEKELGHALKADERNAILISPAPADLPKAVVNGDSITKGVQYSLVDLVKAGTAVEPADAKAGDLVQYWMKKGDGSWIGHAAVISKVFKDASGAQRASLYGAHESLKKIADQDFGGGGLKLTGDDRRVYIVRKK